MFSGRKLEKYPPQYGTWQTPVDICGWSSGSDGSRKLRSASAPSVRRMRSDRAPRRFAQRCAIFSTDAERRTLKLTRAASLVPDSFHLTVMLRLEQDVFPLINPPPANRPLPCSGNAGGLFQAADETTALEFQGFSSIERCGDQRHPVFLDPEDQSLTLVAPPSLYGSFSQDDIVGLPTGNIVTDNTRGGFLIIRILTLDPRNFCALARCLLKMHGAVKRTANSGDEFGQFDGLLAVTNRSTQQSVQQRLVLANAGFVKLGNGLSKAEMDIKGGRSPSASHWDFKNEEAGIDRRTTAIAAIEPSEDLQQPIIDN